MEQAQAIIELWRTFRRRFWLLVGIGGVGIVASVLVAYILPPIYEAEATILVETQQIPNELARSTVTASAAERLQLIQQRLMTRDNLLRLIADLRLFQDRSDLSVSDKIELLREAAVIEPIAITNRPQRRGDVEISAFTILVSFDDPVKSAQIANEFVTMVLDQNLRARSQRASETLNFFLNEEKRLAQELAGIEAEITAFKNQHEDSLPDSLEFRRDQLSRLIESDREADQRLLELEERRGALETALRQAAAIRPAAATLEEQRLQDLEAQLIQKRAIYAESHREVRALRAQIAALEASLPVPEGQDGDYDPRELELASIRDQIKILDSQVVLLHEYKQRLAETRADLEASIEQTPRIETMLNALYRRHASLQAQYAEIVSKRTEAETGEKLEVNQQAERFEVIENALQPEEPVSPDRVKVVALGSAMSIAFAVGVAFLIEILRPAIRSAAQMERLLELRPVVTIPYISTRSERRWRATKISAVLLLIFVGIPAALYAIDQYYMPLQLIGTKMAEETGLDDIIRTVEERL